MRVLLAALLVSSCAAAAPPPVPPQYAPDDYRHDADTLRAAISGSAEACVRGDAAGAARIYHPGVIISTPNQPDQGYDEIVASLKRRCNAQAARMTPLFEDIRFSPSVAMVAVTWTIEPPGRPELASMVRELGYWERTPNGWRYMRGVRWDYHPVPPS